MVAGQITTVKIEAVDAMGTYRNFVAKKRSASVVKWLRTQGYKDIAVVAAEDPARSNDGNNEDNYIVG